MNRPGRRWDVFCRVVDNYGDAAVCWRLSRQLAQEHAGRVRLWIDRTQVLDALQPDPPKGGLSVHAWTAGSDFGEPADIAVDAFGDGLPEAYARRLGPRRLWIKLEYLSAEDWVEGHHGLPSPHPALDVPRWFFFPGFGERTGGLLRERDLLERRDRFDSAGFWARLGLSPPEGATTVSLFGYENVHVGELLEAWSAGSAPVYVALTESRLSPHVEAWLQGQDRRGALEVARLPFLPQARYDELLWACDWNFVRGEDSFVRAQWAAKPFVWQPYPQHADGHRLKLEAFLGRHGEGPGGSLGRLWRAWNGFAPDLAGAWRDTGRERAALAAHARAWCERLAAMPELASRLAAFCENLLK